MKEVCAIVKYLSLCSRSRWQGMSYQDQTGSHSISRHQYDPRKTPENVKITNNDIRCHGHENSYF